MNAHLNGTTYLASFNNTIVRIIPSMRVEKMRQLHTHASTNDEIHVKTEDGLCSIATEAAHENAIKKTLTTFLSR
jgi:hypothetical protein